MSNKKNETLKKVFRLNETRKIAVIEPDVTTYHESFGAFMRRMHYTNTIYNQLNCPSEQPTLNRDNRVKAESKIETITEEPENTMVSLDETNDNNEVVVTASTANEFPRLKNLYCKIMALNDENIQAVVDVVTEEDHYEMNGVSFNFDLLQLKTATIKKLETLVATCTVPERECSSLPLKGIRLQLNPKIEFPIQIEEIAVENEKDLDIEVIEVCPDGDSVSMEEGRKRERKPIQVARDDTNVKIKKRKTEDIAPDNVKIEEANRKKRKTKKTDADHGQVEVGNVDTQKNKSEDIGSTKKRLQTAKKVKRAAEAMEMEVENIRDAKEENRNSTIVEVNVEEVEERKPKRKRCIICRKKRRSHNKVKKYICRRCLKRQERIIDADNIKMKWNRMSHIDRCFRCEKKRHGIDRNEVIQIEPVRSATLNTFYSLCAALQLSPKSTSWNGMMF